MDKYLWSTQRSSLASQDHLARGRGRPLNGVPTRGRTCLDHFLSHSKVPNTQKQNENTQVREGVKFAMITFSVIVKCQEIRKYKMKTHKLVRAQTCINQYSKWCSACEEQSRRSCLMQSGKRKRVSRIL